MIDIQTIDYRWILKNAWLDGALIECIAINCWWSSEDERYRLGSTEFSSLNICGVKYIIANFTNCPMDGCEICPWSCSPCRHPPPRHHPGSVWHWSGSLLCCPTCHLPCHSPGSPGLHSGQDYQSLWSCIKKTQRNLHYRNSCTHQHAQMELQSASWSEYFGRLKSIWLLWLLLCNLPTQEMKAVT